MTVKQIPIAITKADKDGYDAQFIMSHSSADRVNDTISPKAYSEAIKNIDKLIALFNHDADKIIGYWSDFKAKRDSLTGYIKFFHKDWGQMVKEMLDFGIPLGASIGFRGQAKYNEETNGLHFEQIELLETSIVAVPAHPKAQQIAKSYGVDLQSLEIDDTLTSALSGINRDENLIIRSNKALERAKSLLG